MPQHLFAPIIHAKQSNGVVEKGRDMGNVNDKNTVAVIGLGDMGSALANALLTAGFPVTVWNRTATKAQPLTENGAILASNPADAASNSECTIVCLSDHESFVSVIQNNEVANSLRGKRLLQLGVVKAEHSRQSGAWADANDIGYLEGSILGIPTNIKKATATLICSGTKTLYDECKEILSAFGNSHLVSETTGGAYDFDKVYYSFAYASLLGYIQGAALASASGFSVEAYTDIVTERLPNFKDAFNGYGALIAKRNHEGDQASLQVWADGYVKSLELCKDLGVDDTLPSALMQNFEKAISAGYADQEITAIFEVLVPNR